MGLKDQILKADDLKRAPVEVPEWGCTVHVRAMSGRERDAWEQWLVDSKAKRDNVRARYCCLTLVDEKGGRLFSDTDEDIEALGAKSAAALDRVFSAALALNAMSADEQESLEGN